METLDFDRPVRAARGGKTAVASVVLGLLAVGSGVVAVALDLPGLMVVMLGSVVSAIVLGVVSRGAARRNKGKSWGSALARGGVVLGLIGLAIALLLPAM
jgi:hypothetical protein